MVYYLKENIEAMRSGVAEAKNIDKLICFGVNSIESLQVTAFKENSIYKD